MLIRTGINAIRCVLTYRVTQLANNYRRIVTAMTYMLVLYFCGWYGREVLAGGNGWITGDWLINYAGGLVRRGLVGQLLLDVSKFGVDLLWLVFSIQTLTYILIVHYTLKIFFATQREFAWLIVVFSPAFVF